MVAPSITAHSGAPDGVFFLSQAVKDLVEIVKTPGLNTGHSMHISTPITLKQNHQHVTSLEEVLDASPLPLTPADMQTYLEYADQKLGVCDALLHYSPLTCKGYGPDILEDVPTQDLIDASIGLTPSDAIRLK